MAADRLEGVPFLDLKSQFRAISREIRVALNRVVDSQCFILGPEVEALEREVREYCRSKHAVGVSSGTDALLVALMALGVEAGDEVITTPYSFFATAGAVARLGAKPVFVDIDPSSFNLDSSRLAAAITGKSKAILPVHLFGQVAEMGPIRDLANAHGIPIVEDAAQSIGAEWHGERAGSLGDLGSFSFFPSKNLGAFGDGGMVTTNSVDLADRTRALRAHGATRKYHHDLLGGNFRLDAIQAAVLRVKLRHLDGWTRARQRCAATYRRLFAEIGLDRTIRLPPEPPHGRHVYNQFVIRCEARDELLTHLKARGIASQVYYPVPLHLQKALAYLGGGPGAFPEAERAAREALALPIYPELTERQQTLVVDAISEFVAGCG